MEVSSPATGSGSAATTRDISPRPGVLHVLPHQGVWGVARFVIELSRHERMDGAPDEIMLTERPLDMDGDFQAPATPVHFLGLPGATERTRGQRLADVAEARGLGTIRVHCARELELAAAAKAAAPGLQVEACLFDAPRPTGSLGSLLERRRLRRVVRSLDRTMAMSPAVAREMEPFGVPFEALAPGVDLQRFSPAEVVSSWRQARLPDPDTLLVGTLMAAAPGKRQDVLMEAVTRRHAAGRLTALMMVGDGPRFAELKESVRGSDFLFARRRVLDSPGFFQRIDAFALHAEEESVPMSLAEALASGCPSVVADRTPDRPVASWAGDQGIIYTEPGDVDAVIDALDRLADPARRAAMGEAARERAKGAFALGRLRATLARGATA